MSLKKVKFQSPDPVLERASYEEHTLARIAHVNAALDTVSAAVKAVGVLPASANLTGGTVAPLREEVEARLDAIETKLNALINALS